MGFTDVAKLNSKAIGYKGAQTRYYAPQQAIRIGKPLNVLVTVNFAQTAICPTRATDAFGKLHLRFRKWITRPSKQEPGPATEATWAYVFENARDGKAFDIIGPGLPHNVHVLWHAHVPLSRITFFEKLLPIWLDDIAGPHQPNAIKVTRVVEDNGIHRYSLKGATAAVAEHFKVPMDKRGPQGAIIGRRSGTSRNLGSSARKAMDRALGIRRRTPGPRPSDSSL